MTYIVTDKERYQMTTEEKAERAATKAIHKKLREPLRGGKSGDRYDLLAWAFARGLPFRRCERSHRVQMCGGEPADASGRPVKDGATPYEHNMPYAYGILAKLIQAGAAPLDVGNSAKHPEYKAIEAWIKNPGGAVPAPPPRPKASHVRAVDSARQSSIEAA